MSTSEARLLGTDGRLYRTVMFEDMINKLQITSCILSEGCALREGMYGHFLVILSDLDGIQPRCGHTLEYVMVLGGDHDQ